MSGVCLALQKGEERAELSVLRNLSRNNNVVLLRPYKGNGIVILDKPDYISKVELLLSDASKSKKLDGDVLELCIK